MTDQKSRRIVIVTGMSGAGKSSALKVLEDLGYEAVDNLPLSLLPALIGGAAADQQVAVGVDIRTREFAADAFAGMLDELGQLAGEPPHLLYLDCETDALMRRFTETRRRHPLADDRPVSVGIDLERQRLAPVRERADTVIDTSTMIVSDFRKTMQQRFSLAGKPAMRVFLQSFSYRNGLPRDADLVFDVRFLRNPHYDPVLRPGTGQDQAVQDFIRTDPGFDDFWTRLTGLLELLAPRFEEEGKSYLTVAVGCTGGQHRSVFLAEALAGWFAERGVTAELRHRELNQQGGNK
tara:strand:- start:61148 stop:62026 length:879 start_codon:yes stop_codon:yes gene_type:complete